MASNEYSQRTLQTTKIDEKKKQYYLKFQQQAKKKQIGCNKKRIR